MATRDELLSALATRSREARRVRRERIREQSRLRRRACEILSDLVARIPELQGPLRGPVGDAIAAQAHWVSSGLGCNVVVPERDLVIINRPA